MNNSWVLQDYIGLWNERPYTKAYILELRKQLDANNL